MTNQRLVLEFSQTAHSILPSVFVRTNDTSDNPSIFLLRPSGCFARREAYYHNTERGPA
jgi:hypothetical protein